MGIRFTCPNGHQLHVKEFLAGKRGICPECDTKFVIPAVGLVEDVTASPLESSPAQLAPPPLPAAAEQNTPDVWYVRAVSGDQYGPATTEIMRGWADEGRLQVDSWVWHAGWPAWKTGTEALELLKHPIAPAPPAPVATLPSQPSVAKRHPSHKRSRRDRARVITIALVGLVLLLLIAVVLVVSRN